MGNSWKQIASAAAIGLAFAAPAVGAQQTAPPAASVPRYAMPSTQVWDVAAESGEIYRIFVSYPASEPPAEGWPVLYVLDGNASFAAFAEARRIQEFDEVGKSIVVGVGYPTDLPYDTRRMYDMTSATPPPDPWRERFSKVRSGGRDKFLDFLTGRLRNELGKRHRIDLNRQALFGHSLGGLFAVHTLYSRPAAFHAIIAASPSLFWHGDEMFDAERDFTARLKAGKIPKVSRLLVVAGEREETILERWDPEDFIERMTALSGYGLRLRSEIYEDEGHMTVPARAVTDTLRFAFSWP